MSLADDAFAADKDGWAHLLPAGTFSGRDGRGPYTLDANAIVRAFAELGMTLAVDYEHQTQAAPENGQPAPAAGWIVALEAREDGLYGYIEWTARAAAMIRAREYRYLSPVFEYEPRTGRVAAIIGAGLTNQPNLHLTALNRAQSSQAKGTTMNEELLERLRFLFNLPTLADEAAIAAEVEKLQARLAAPAAAAMKKSLNLAADAGLPQTLDAVCAFDFKKPPELDLAKFVPRAEYDRVAGELASERERALNALVDGAIRAALEAHKICPANEMSMRAFCRKDPEEFARFIATAPVILGDAPASAAHGKTHPPVHPLLADAERRAARQ